MDRSGYCLPDHDDGEDHPQGEVSPLSLKPACTVSCHWTVSIVTGAEFIQLGHTPARLQAVTQSASG